MEQNSKFYDEIYEKGGHKMQYFKSPEKSIYYPIWEKISNLIYENEKIIDLGCGVGQLAELLIKEGKTYLLGIDFSEIAINKAKEKNLYCDFIIRNLLEEETYDLIQEGEIFLCCEVLEHIEKDLSIIKNLKKGKRLIFTVPNFLSKGHVRCFKNEEEIKKRYEDLIKIDYIYSFSLSKENIIYLIDSIIK